jgi:hypothetical protein
MRPDKPAISERELKACDAALYGKKKFSQKGPRKETSMSPANLKNGADRKPTPLKSAENISF